MTRKRESQYDRDMASKVPLRILLADDHPTNQQIGKMILNRLGYRVDIVSNGQEVLNALESATYDLILMDIEMPVMDGVEATVEIRRRWGKTGPRIVAVTANAMRGDRDRYLEVGMDDYVSKPIRTEALVNVLKADDTTVLVSSPLISKSDGAAGHDDSTLDLCAIQKLQNQIGDNNADLALLIQSFLDVGPGLCEDLVHAAEGDDVSVLYRAAHTLKTSANDFGARELASLSAQLEISAQAKEFDAVVDLSERVVESYQQADRMLRDYLMNECSGVPLQ